MADEPTWTGVGKGLLVLGMLWWSWVGYAWLTSVVEPEEALADPRPRRLFGHERRALGQGQHEHQVEEELERCDPSLLAEHGGEAARCCGSRGAHWGELGTGVR
jgi:hypothetical protein